VPPAKPTHVAVASADDARQAVAAAQDAGVDFIKVYSNLSREAFFAIADESRKRGLTFGGHVPIAITVHEAAEAGMASIEHFWGVLLACSSREAELTAEEQKENARPPAAQFRGHFTTARAAIDSFDETKAQAIFRTFVAHGTYQVPTLEALRRFGVPHALPPGSDYMPPEIRRILMAGQGRMDPALSEAGRLYYGEVLKLVGEMRRAGVSFMAGTDSAVPGFMLHQELERFVDAGLSPLEALQTATIVPARFLHREAQTGSIAAGKTADLVLLDADPTRDIRNTTTIRSVVLRGEVFDRDALDSMLEHIKTAVAAR